MSLMADAYAVLLPAIDDLILTDQLTRFLEQGGRSLLIGETRTEYVLRQMSADRQNGETAEKIWGLTCQITRLAGPSLIALDQEPGGIQRLHGLIPQLPAASDLHDMSSKAIEESSYQVGRSARQLGVSMFLSPVIDVVTGKNEWLRNRTLGRDAAEVARIGAAFIRGVESAGVVATAKHFPGHHDIDGDPALEVATVSGGSQELAHGMLPFRSAIEAGSRAFMTGPALVPGMDPNMPSSLSATTILALRNLGFTGLIVSDDLDAAGTLRNDRDVPTAAIEALRAGSDLLLLSAANDLDQIRSSILGAVASGFLEEARLSEAAGRVRALAESTV